MKEAAGGSLAERMLIVTITVVTEMIAVVTETIAVTIAAVTETIAVVTVVIEIAGMTVKTEALPGIPTKVRIKYNTSVKCIL